MSFITEEWCIHFSFCSIWPVIDRQHSLYLIVTWSPKVPPGFSPCFPYTYLMVTVSKTKSIPVNYHLFMLITFFIYWIDNWTDIGLTNTTGLHSICQTHCIAKQAITRHGESHYSCKWKQICRNDSPKYQRYVCIIQICKYCSHKIKSGGFLIAYWK